MYSLTFLMIPLISSLLCFKHNAHAAVAAFGMHPTNYNKQSSSSLSFDNIYSRNTGIASWHPLHMSSSSEEEGEEMALLPSTLRSMTFCNLGKQKEPQLLCEFLMEIGACSTAIVDADRGTSLEQAIFSEPGDETWQMDTERAAVICGDLAVGRNVWNRCNVTAHFSASINLQNVASMVEECLDLPLRYSVSQVPNRDWVVHVQQSWKPIVVANMVLRFPWHTDDDVQDALTKQGLESAVTELKLEGGIAFGTGEHPTTQLCLAWIQEQVPLHNSKQNRAFSQEKANQQEEEEEQQEQQEQEPMKIIDYGAGSGVLGMAACAIDDSITAIGVDIDVDAVRIANANSITNGLTMLNYLPPLLDTADGESKSVLMKGLMVDSSSSSSSSSSSGKKNNDNDSVLPSHWNQPVYDVCVANILAGPLVTLAPTLAGLVRPGGALGLSGILAPQADMVLEAYAPLFDNVKVSGEQEGWILITGTRKK